MKVRRGVMYNFIVATECAIEYNGKFLIIKRPDGVHAAGLLSFPGGKFEASDAIDNEDAAKQAVKREVLEEVGLNLIDPINYVRTSCFFDDKNGKQVLDIIYHCKLEKTKIKVAPSAREVPEHYWLTYEEIVKAPNCPKWLKSYIKTIIRLL